MGHLYKPFGTIKIWPSWQGGSGKVKICPRMAWIWLWSRPEAPKLVYDPWNGPKMFPPTTRDWFKSISWPFKALQPLYIKKNINYHILPKISISEILTFTASNDQTILFGGDFWIFLSLPHVGWLRKIEISRKKCIVWSVEAVKVTCIFFQNFGFKILKASETSKNHYGGPKNPKIIQKLSIFEFLNWRDHRKTCFSAPKGAISAKSTKSEKGVRLCNTACMGLPWKI